MLAVLAFGGGDGGGPVVTDPPPLAVVEPVDLSRAVDVDNFGDARDIRVEFSEPAGGLEVDSNGNVYTGDFGPAIAQVPDVLIEPAGASTWTISIEDGGRKIGSTSVAYADESLGLVLVDVNFPSPPLTRLLRERLSSEFGTRATTVVVTHWHPDHSGGIAGFADTRVLGHANLIRRLSETTEGVDLGGPGTRFVAPPRTAAGLPNESVEDSLRLGAVRVNHYPAAHTDGDLVVWFPDGVVAVGDLLWPGVFPSIDVTNGGSVQGMRRALQDLLSTARPEQVFIPGHGESATTLEIREMVTMLDYSIAAVGAQIEAGETLVQIQQADLFDDWKDWSHPIVTIEQWIKLVYLSLEGPGNGESAPAP